MDPNSSEEPLENEHLQALVKELTEKIGQLFADNDQIKKILESIEKEGYQVDLVVASLSRLLPNQDDLEVEMEEEDGEEIEELDEATYELNPFDYAFLQAIKVKP
ncbi:MAG: hypothetical protein HY282_06525 [Nitrospirae bacterium]|nr:hypothetical protein [Candidatus Manganitrophaceae bacterium]